MQFDPHNVTGKYILKGKKALEERDLFKWAEWTEKNRDKRRVKETMLKNKKWVSTVFLGLDYNWGGGRPLLFETMIFDTNKKRKYKLGKIEHESIGEEVDMERYSTWEEAEEGHERMVKKYG